MIFMIILLTLPVDPVHNGNTRYPEMYNSGYPDDPTYIRPSFLLSSNRIAGDYNNNKIKLIINYQHKLEVQPTWSVMLTIWGIWLWLGWESEILIYLLWTQRHSYLITGQSSDILLNKASSVLGWGEKCKLWK